MFCRVWPPKWNAASQDAWPQGSGRGVPQPLPNSASRSPSAVASTNLPRRVKNPRQRNRYSTTAPVFLASPLNTLARSYVHLRSVPSLYFEPSENTQIEEEIETAPCVVRDLLTTDPQSAGRRPSCMSPGTSPNDCWLASNFSLKYRSRRRSHR